MLIESDNGYNYEAMPRLLALSREICVNEINNRSREMLVLLRNVFG